MRASSASSWQQVTQRLVSPAGWDGPLRMCNHLRTINAPGPDWGDLSKSTAILVTGQVEVVVVVAFVREMKTMVTGDADYVCTALCGDEFMTAVKQSVWLAGLLQTEPRGDSRNYWVEIEPMAKNPFVSGVLIRSRSFAKTFEVDKRDWKINNAMRHAAWTAALTLWKDADFAAATAARHEEAISSGEYDTFVDWLNNHEGIAVGQRLKEEREYDRARLGESEFDAKWADPTRIMREAIRDLFNEGQLYCQDFENGGVTNCG